MMDLTKLFETQKPLDERIVREKGLEGQDLLPEKILALQVELGELANEWRGFKFWSENRKPNLYKEEIDLENDRSRSFNPLLEEYVDCLHFILSIGLELGIDTEREYSGYLALNTTIQFSVVFYDAANFSRAVYEEWDQEYIPEAFEELVIGFLGLGEMLGFTWEQIEAAYYAKNQINHERQASGY